MRGIKKPAPYRTAATKARRIPCECFRRSPFAGLFERSQEVLERPLGDASTLPPRIRVRGTEVDTCIDAGVDYILGCIREVGIRARLLHDRREVARQRKGHCIRPEEEFQGAGHGGGNIIGP